MYLTRAMPPGEFEPPPSGHVSLRVFGEGAPGHDGFLFLGAFLNVRAGKRKPRRKIKKKYVLRTSYAIGRNRTSRPLKMRRLDERDEGAPRHDSFLPLPHSSPRHMRKCNQVHTLCPGHMRKWNEVHPLFVPWFDSVAEKEMHSRRRYRALSTEHQNKKVALQQEVYAVWRNRTSSLILKLIDNVLREGAPRHDGFLALWNVPTK
ncbi:hypothetical protein C8F04DRAFT_1173140 [Mycena alexandri]|uniref:Uncharacterized protein n=1 Tax=Mycena alexandri TaxID=1745969 RepID=A0AAD6TJM7_9AGAR|nr:hypothetical protein C8F04DRAFT_1173140 [Mycena alexandri]